MLSTSTLKPRSCGKFFSLWATLRTTSSTKYGEAKACSVTYFSSSRLRMVYTGLEPEASASSTKSSIQLKPSVRSSMCTMQRWLWAPSSLMALEQGQTVITGTDIFRLKSNFSSSWFRQPVRTQS